MNERLRDGVSGSASYFREVIAEVKKVRWPTRAELLNYTVIVIVVCLIMFVLTYAFDLLVTEGFKLLGIAGQ